MELRERGYNDCILRVDLNRGTFTREPLPNEAMRTLLGGKGLGAYLLLHGQPAGVDPLSPENCLILNVGPLTGTNSPTAGRFGATTKSPATGTYLDTYSGGYFGNTMKYAGYDAIVITGRLPEPGVLVVDDERIELRPGGHLWGKTIPEATEAVREEFGRDWQSLVIGPPGEKLALMASIFNETRALARGGVGAVMGSKRLKAIVARGTGTVRVHNRATYDRALQLANRAIRMSSTISRMTREGTANLLEFVNVIGALPTRNFQEGEFEQAGEITGDAWRQRSWKKNYACFGCPIACSKITRPVDGQVLEGPEYETIFAVGSNCGIADHDTIIRMSRVCDTYGIDTISAGGTIAFVMELFEKGFVKAQELDGIEPRFGDCRAALALLEKMAKAEGCGEWLAEGTRRIAARFPEGEAFAMEVKGLEMPAYHPSAAKGIALAYAVSEIGASHLRGAPLSEVLGGADPLTLEDKARLFRDHQAESALWHSAVLCCFPGFGMNLKELYQLVDAATGFDYGSAKDFEMVGEGISTLARMFNVREGYSRAQDTLPARNTVQPLGSGPAKGQIVELDALLEDYYRLVGWDQNGVPTKERLARLGLADQLPAD
ncbi:MAG: aldehyde ferredoxin oxidoreductase family protein [Rudaea sp.]